MAVAHGRADGAWRAARAGGLLCLALLLAPARRPRARAPSPGSAGPRMIRIRRRRVDHGAWGAFLTRYRADRRRRQRTGSPTARSRRPTARRSTATSRGSAALPISRYGRAEQLAYWINLYNALMVRLVLEHYPIASIRDLGGRPGPVDRRALDRAAGRDRRRRRSSLSDIEHRILRPIWQDPRVLYALSCAARRLPEPAAGAVPGRPARAPAERGGDGLRQRPALHRDRGRPRSRSPASTAGTRRTSVAPSARSSTT